MRNCENARYELSQKALDEVYAKLLKQLDAASQAKLRAAQSSWVRFRQADAEFAAQEAGEGTLAPLLKITVMADLTEARTAELEKSLQP
jgi:uncharacterized protein YecT (DUF1311 family)